MIFTTEIYYSINFVTFSLKNEKHQDNKKSMLSGKLLSNIKIVYSCHYFNSGFNVKLQTEKLLSLGFFQENPSGGQSIEIRDLTEVYRYFKEWCTSYIDQIFVDKKVGSLMAAALHNNGDESLRPFEMRCRFTTLHLNQLNYCNGMGESRPKNRI